MSLEIGIYGSNIANISMTMEVPNMGTDLFGEIQMKNCTQSGDRAEFLL